MAASIISKPGTEFGPCEEDCSHSDCAELRGMAETLCDECDEPVGYDTRYYQDKFRMAHAHCLE